MRFFIRSFFIVLLLIPVYCFSTLSKELALSEKPVSSKAPVSSKESTSGIFSWFKRSKEERFEKKYKVVPTGSISIIGEKGAISVAGVDGDELSIEAVKTGKEKDLPNTEILVEVGQKGATIKTKTKADSDPVSVEYLLRIPKASSLSIKNEKGIVNVRGIEGKIDIESRASKITVERAKGTISVKAHRGKVFLDQVALEEKNNIFIVSKEAVELQLPSGVNADLDAKTLKGKVYSPEIYVTIEPTTAKLTKDFWKNQGRSVKGTIGSGGAKIIIDVTKGNVTIRER